MQSKNLAAKKVSPIKSQIQSLLTVVCFVTGRITSLVLESNESEVDTFPVQEFTVGAPLHSSAALKAHNHICITNRRQTVSNGDGGSAYASLKTKYQIASNAYCVKLKQIYRDVQCVKKTAVLKTTLQFKESKASWSHCVKRLLHHSFALIVQG